MRTKSLLANGQTLAKAGLVTFLLASWQFAGAQVTYNLVTTGLATVTFESGPSELEVGDVDGDGDLDIASIGDHGAPQSSTQSGVMVWKNNGTGTSWSILKSGNFGYGGIALGDVNNDGKMDVGYGMHHNNSSTDFGNGVLEVMLGDGSGSNWTPYDDSLGAQGQNWGMFGTDFADLNNDGLLDIGSNGFGCCDGIWLYKNLGNGKWEVTDGNLGGNSNHQFKFGDFNNDGHVDCATANEWGQVWKNKGGGVITYMQMGIPNSAYMTFDVADVNNDGGKDIAVESSGSLKVYTFNTSANSWQSISTGLPASGVEGVELADMDMDGNCDAVVWTTSAITIYKGDGAGNWTAGTTIPVTVSQYGLSCSATGDFNTDGYTDIVYLAKAGSNKNLLKVYLSSVASHGMNLLSVFPKGNECFVPGSVQFINWLSQVPSGPASTVTIEFSSNGTGGPWTTVVNNAPNSGIYQWTVPNVNSSTCFLKYTLTQGSSTQVVTIANPFGVGSCATPTTEVVENQNIINDLVAFPNPMSTMGYVQFTLTESAFTEIKLYDMLGKEVSTPTSGRLNSGEHRIVIPASQFESGIYFVVVNSAGMASRSRIVIARTP